MWHMGRLRGNNGRGSRVWWHKKERKNRNRSKSNEGLQSWRGETGSKGHISQGKSWRHTKPVAEEVLEALPWRRKGLYHRCSPSAGKEQRGTLSSNGGLGTTCFGH